MLNETQSYMAKLGELCSELNRARDAEMSAAKKTYESQKNHTDAMVKRHNAEVAYREHLFNQPGREPGDQLI